MHTDLASSILTDYSGLTYIQCTSDHQCKPLVGTSNVQAFDYKISEIEMLAETSDGQRVMNVKFLVSKLMKTSQPKSYFTQDALQSAPAPHTLHLRQCNILTRDRDNGLYNSNSISFITHQWTNAFFS
jgi:hypothetical protein